MNKIVTPAATPRSTLVANHLQPYTNPALLRETGPQMSAGRGIYVSDPRAANISKVSADYGAPLSALRKSWSRRQRRRWKSCLLPFLYGQDSQSGHRSCRKADLCCS